MTEYFCIRAWISGRVQGVFFRSSTADQARRLNLSGSAKNLSDGRVEVVAAGAAGDVRELLDWLNTGPPMARVDHVQWESFDTPPADNASFSIG